MAKIRLSNGGPRKWMQKPEDCKCDVLVTGNVGLKASKAPVSTVVPNHIQRERAVEQKLSRTKGQAVP